MPKSQSQSNKLYDQVADLKVQLDGSAVNFVTTTIYDSGLIPVDAVLRQVIIENRANSTIYLKLWGLAYSSVPTVSSGSWSTAPFYVLPAESQATADYTFAGDDNAYGFNDGILMNLGRNGGDDAAVGAVIDATVTMYFENT